MIIINNPPLPTYPGGKWRLARWIISHFPPHINYLEPCGGGAAVLLQKQPSQLETYNDIDGHVVNFFRVLRDNPEELVEAIALTPWSREEHGRCYRELKSLDSIEWARRFYAATIQSRGGPQKGGWKYAVSAWNNNSSRWSRTAKLAKLRCESLIAIANRLLDVQIENKDALETIELYDTPYTLTYFDPPYPSSTRTDGLYLEETEDKFHVDAASLLKKAEGCVVVSGFSCPLYDSLYEDWIRVDKDARTRSGSNTTESLWLSPRTARNSPALQQVSMI